MYLDDPDGNGLELYRDRPRAEWQWRADGELVMAVLPLDLDNLLTDAEPRGATQIDEPTAAMRVGHIHLQVSDLVAAEKFYGGVLGFKVMTRLPGALFVAADGYHHHIGLNTWHTAGAAPAPSGMTGLRSFTIKIADAAEAAQLRQRLTNAGVDHGESTHPEPAQATTSVRFRDPWGNEITARSTQDDVSLKDDASPRQRAEQMLHGVAKLC